MRNNDSSIRNQQFTGIKRFSKRGEFLDREERCKMLIESESLAQHCLRLYKEAPRSEELQKVVKRLEKRGLYEAKSEKRLASLMREVNDNRKEARRSKTSSRSARYVRQTLTIEATHYDGEDKTAAIEQLQKEDFGFLAS